MSIVNSSILQHPIQLQFIGRAGREFVQTSLRNRGFVSHTASINTSGLKGNHITSTDVNLTAFNWSQNEINVGDMYSMSCKLIASNDANADHLHFDSATSLDVTSVYPVGENLIRGAVDRVSLTALGTIVGKEIVPGDADHPSGCTITLKSVDIDPITKSPVVWFTKHHICPMPSLESAARMWQEGAIVHISGVVVGYDSVSFMWISSVNCISVVGPGDANGVQRVRRSRRQIRQGAVIAANDGIWQQMIRAYASRNMARIGMRNGARHMGSGRDAARKRLYRRNSIM
ncbi:uncharacterized protein MELLADRAFT_123950 [Melampsora larici-populina 98AG31]|uniref:Uncharacterized protein n=1 Tax=Melampsora larici-populina (strain 98AG31 / pathotype 3-4-7) TaxID=747676 RepID=F4R325_MELLP|nr:uncharacterized protein MELLADRAFT_123950 [Melampsora larici-populina 98AG31]EGG13243.1 hypothetical protein MELLADRAFT_123950 [Melampsora larici-populina 98AG31]